LCWRSSLLDAYRGTTDDEGETIADALQAIDGYIQRILLPYSLVVECDRTLIAIAFTVLVRGRHYIDPVATASSYKNKGIGAAAVSAVLDLLSEDGIAEVGAVITQGNLPSERLFSSLGFERVGVWS
jgi:L-amino acid N-acyltransferase YncA